MKPYDVYSKDSLLTETSVDDTQSKIERRSHHVDDCEEAKGAAILMGSLFAEGIATYKDIVICLEALCPSLVLHLSRFSVRYFPMMPICRINDITKFRQRGTIEVHCPFCRCTFS